MAFAAKAVSAASPFKTFLLGTKPTFTFLAGKQQIPCMICMALCICPEIELEVK